MALNEQIDFLKQAIRSNDLVYLSTIKLTDYNEITINDKISFLKLLKTNIDTFGLNTDILEIAKNLIKSGNHSYEFRNGVDDFCKELGRKTNDYGKMCFLKGKIEYLKECVENNYTYEIKEKVVDLDALENAIDDKIDNKVENE